MSAPSSDRLERLLGAVLRWGALTSTTLLAAGLLLELAGIEAGMAARLTNAGLIVLMATPVGRVAPTRSPAPPPERHLPARPAPLAR